MSLTAASAALALFQSDAAQAADPVWIGCWGNEQLTLLLEPERAGRLSDDDPEFFRLTADGNELRAVAWSQPENWTVEREGDQLRFGSDGTVHLLERLEATPDALLVLPYELAAKREVDPALREQVVAELAEREVKDQEVRQRAQAGKFSEELRSEMRSIDADNTAYLLSLLGRVGWIDAERFGAEASGAAFLIVQHCSDLRLQQTALPHIEVDVRGDRVNGQHYALLYDRLRLRLGYKQRFGSQLSTLETGETVLMPLEDPERVDEYRGSLGMQTLDEYLEWIPIPSPVRGLEEALANPRPQPAQQGEDEQP